MRIPFKIGNLEFTLATSYDEMTTGEFFALRKSEEGNVSSMLSALSGVSSDVWDSVSSESANRLFNPNADGWFPLKYLYTPMDWDNMPIPTSLEINGKKIYAGRFSPTLKQKHLMQQAIEKAAKESDPIDAAIEILAMNFQPIVTGEKFSIEDAVKFQEAIKQTKITEAFPLATFFLAKLLGLENEMRSSWLTKAVRKSQQQGSGSSNGSESSTQLMPSREETRSNTTKFGISLMRLFSRSFTRAKSKQISEGVTEK